MNKVDREKLTMLELMLPMPTVVAGPQLFRKTRSCDQFLQVPFSRVSKQVHAWKFLADAAVWGRMSPQLLNVEVLSEGDQLGSRMYSLISLEEQDDEDIEQI